MYLKSEFKQDKKNSLCPLSSTKSSVSYKNIKNSVKSTVKLKSKSELEFLFKSTLKLTSILKKSQINFMDFAERVRYFTIKKDREGESVSVDSRREGRGSCDGEGREELSMEEVGR